MGVSCCTAADFISILFSYFIEKKKVLRAPIFFFMFVLFALAMAQDEDADATTAAGDDAATGGDDGTTAGGDDGTTAGGDDEGTTAGAGTIAGCLMTSGFSISSILAITSF